MSPWARMTVGVRDTHEHASTTRSCAYAAVVAFACDAARVRNPCLVKSTAGGRGIKTWNGRRRHQPINATGRARDRWMEWSSHVGIGRHACQPCRVASASTLPARAAVPDRPRCHVTRCTIPRPACVRVTGSPACARRGCAPSPAFDVGSACLPRQRTEETRPSLR